MDDSRDHFIIIKGGEIPLPSVRGRGRKKGTGKNIRLLNAMEVGQSAWGIPANKLHSLRQTAHVAKIKIKIRQIPETETYVIKRLT